MSAVVDMTRGRLPAPSQPCEQSPVVPQPHGRYGWSTSGVYEQVFLDHDHVGVIDLGHGIDPIPCRWPPDPVGHGRCVRSWLWGDGA